MPATIEPDDPDEEEKNKKFRALDEGDIALLKTYGLGALPPPRHPCSRRLASSTLPSRGTGAGTAAVSALCFRLPLPSRERPNSSGRQARTTRRLGQCRTISRS